MKKILCVSAVFLSSISSHSFSVELTVEQLDAKLRMAYQEGINESLKNNKPSSDKATALNKAQGSAKATKTWIWCSDNKCSNRSTFSTYKGCYEYTKLQGGYCY